MPLTGQTATNHFIERRSPSAWNQAKALWYDLGMANLAPRFPSPVLIPAIYVLLLCNPAPGAAGPPSVEATTLPIGRLASSQDPVDLNSLFPEATKPPQFTVEDANTAVQTICAHQDYNSFDALLTLREHSRDRYNGIPAAIRARILLSQFVHTRAGFNEWGHLSLKSDSEAAQVLIECGQIAVEPLIPLLDDKASATFFGSADSTESIEKKYRRCDFAYRFLCRILGLDYRWSAEVAERDQNISNLKESLRAATSMHSSIGGWDPCSCLGVRSRRLYRRQCRRW